MKSTNMTHLKPLRHAAFFAMLLTASQLYAASLPPVARDEIEGLLSRLGLSDCKFKRNGSWYTAEEAQAHLRRKLDYLIDRDAVASTEQFIERAASKSSKSGKAYEMQCGKDASVASGQWMRTQLRALRDGGKSGPN